MNLAVNARDAMPRGGTLSIRTAARMVAKADLARHPDARPGWFVVLTVADTGCGMDDAVLKRLFEPFFTTKDVGRGTGLGLASVYGIVKQHEGWVEVASRLGHGTTFSVFLPASRDAASPQGAAPGVPVPADGHESILVVEDETAVRRLIASTLRRRGYRVIEASDGLEALELWREHQAQIHLVITDMVMPRGVSGAELGELLRVEREGIKLIFISGYSRDHVSIADQLVEGRNYLAKPFDASALVAVVRRRLDEP
jgi:CheY-like chemotaxis protein